MNPWLEVLLGVAAIGSTVIQGLGLYIISDLRDRVVRLEGQFFPREPRIDERQQVIQFHGGQ